MNKSSRIMITFGVALITLGVILYVCSKPIFSLTRTETHTTNLPPVQKSETIIDYSFVLEDPDGVKDVVVQMDPNQTLSIQAKSNMLNDSLNSGRTFDFSIVIPQPDGIDAVYFSQKDTKSFSTIWSPTISGTYHLKFTSLWSGNMYGMDIYAKVVKTWTAVETRTDTVTVTEQKPLIDFGSDFQYVIYGIAVLGVVFALVGLSYNLRHRTRTSVQG